MGRGKMLKEIYFELIKVKFLLCGGMGVLNRNEVLCKKIRFFCIFVFGRGIFCIYSKFCRCCFG